MWKDYFWQLQKKYSMRLSIKEPLVIRFDGKDVTKDKKINLLYNTKGSFMDAMDKTAWYFSDKYDCYAIYGTDEISFVTNEPLKILEDLDKTITNHSNEVISLFSQYFFDYFNTFYKGEKIFFHGKCFSIPSGKIVSYIKYRSKSIKNVITTYFLNRNDIKMGKSKLSERINKCTELKEYNILKEIENGTLYYCGNKLSIEKFLDNSITTSNLHSIIKKETDCNLIDKDEELDIEFLDF